MTDSLNAVATTDDEALFRAVLANPADDAPRLVYADYLDERGDSRGEYLRADWEAAKEAESGRVSHRTLERLAELRTEMPPNWMIDVSVGPSGWVRQIAYDDSRPSYGRLTIAPWSWSEAEQALDHLGRCLYLSAWLIGPERWGPRSEEFLAVHGGEGPSGEMVFTVGGRLGGENRRPLDRHDYAEPAPVRGIKEGFRLRATAPLLRIAKWAYFVGTFWPGLAGYHTDD